LYRPKPIEGKNLKKGNLIEKRKKRKDNRQIESKNSFLNLLHTKHRLCVDCVMNHYHTVALLDISVILIVIDMLVIVIIILAVKAVFGHPHCHFCVRYPIIFFTVMTVLVIVIIILTEIL
jgi:hypothetical protein